MSQYAKQLSCDLVVMGGGGSGLVAAIRAAQLTGKQVIVLEKTKRTGGGAAFATFMRTFDSKWQRDRGITCQTIDYIRTVQDEMYWAIDPKLAANAVRGTGWFFDWLMELDPSLEDLFTLGKYLFPNEFDPVGPQSDNSNPRTFGKIVVDTMAENADKFGVQILTDCSAVDMEATDGHVEAVIAKSGNERIRIGCSAAVLATGSWIQNPEVAQAVNPNFNIRAMDMSPHMNPAYTGDGLTIAEHAGAYIDKDSFCFRFMGPMVRMRSAFFRAMMQSKYIITVNKEAKRYCSEPLSHMKYFEDGIVQARQPGMICYHIFDMSCVEATMKLPPVEMNKYMLEVMGSPNLPDDIDEVQRMIEESFARKEKHIFRADTIDELAVQLELDPAALKETIDRYNSLCEEGADWDYAKPTEALVAMKKGPYFAVKAAPGTDGAFGGVLVDDKMQAYTKDKTSVVKGLYVTGDFASGRFVNIDGNKKQVLNDMSWAFSSGFLAGTNAAEYISNL